VILRRERSETCLRQAGISLPAETVYPQAKKKAPRFLGAPQNLRESVASLTYFFFVFKAFKAKVNLDLYRLAVFSVKVLFRIALSKSEKVAEASFSAVAVSPAVKAARIRRIDVRTRVRFMRLIAARAADCRIFFNTDFVFFLCLIVVP
jgi:hypothetical protein